MTRILLIVGGGIAAYKTLDLIRRLREQHHHVRVVMTRAATEFVTPLSVGALTNERVFTNLFDLDDEREIGHIRLSRDADVIVVAPATADLLAKMAGGHADDLATCVLMATNKPVLVAPAMNPRMWSHPATVRNVAQLTVDGINFVGPEIGEMAERGEAGAGRLAETGQIIAAIAKVLWAHSQNRGLLTGRHVLVTSGPTHEAIDPVRYIANRSSGKQGHSIAAAAARAGARVTLISGPVSIPDPVGVEVVRVETAAQMLAAVQAALPADIAIFAAAVADWRVAEVAEQKLKKTPENTEISGGSATLNLIENPDILKTVARGPMRPKLVIGFAAETSHVIEHAKRKLARKGADWIVANDVSHRSGIGNKPGGVMGGDHNVVHVISASGVETWPELAKSEVAERLVAAVARYVHAAETSS